MRWQKYYDEVSDWLLVNGTRLILGFIILIVGLKIITFLRSRVRSRLAKRQVHSSLQPFFVSLTITGLYIALILLVFDIIGFPLSVFTTVIGAFGVAAGLALSGTFQNFAGGVLILLLKPFEVDDSVIAQGQEGKVTSIQIFYTVLLTADNKTIIIPNGKLFNEVIINVSREGLRRLDFEIKLSYTADIEKTKDVIWAAIKSNDKILDNPGNRVGISALEVDGVKFVVNVWVNTVDWLAVKLYLQEKIIIDLGGAGIKLPGT